MTNNTTTTIPATELDLPAVVDTHLAAYCEPDAARRAALVAQVWQPEGQLLDPPFDGTGHDAIAGMTGIVLTHYPAHTFRRTTAVDAHHTFARYGWELVAPDGIVAVTGVDVIEIGDDGRLVRVVGFFGALV